MLAARNNEMEVQKPGINLPTFNLDIQGFKTRFRFT